MGTRLVTTNTVMLILQLLVTLAALTLKEAMEITAMSVIPERGKVHTSLDPGPGSHTAYAFLPPSQSPPRPVRETWQMRNHSGWLALQGRPGVWHMVPYSWYLPPDTITSLLEKKDKQDELRGKRRHKVFLTRLGARPSREMRRKIMQRGSKNKLINEEKRVHREGRNRMGNRTKPPKKNRHRKKGKRKKRGKKRRNKRRHKRG